MTNTTTAPRFTYPVLTIDERILEARAMVRDCDSLLHAVGRGASWQRTMWEEQRAADVAYLVLLLARRDADHYTDADRASDDGMPVRD